ncbi:hypothetical protein CKQ90_35330, partial [Klebsiella pneumoniae]
QPANLEFNAEGTPVSRDFDDVYFSNDNGLEETRVTYVKQNAIQPANLEFNAEGTPVSRDFDDVYFSNDNGLEETR